MSLSKFPADMHFGKYLEGFFTQVSGSLTIRALLNCSSRIAICCMSIRTLRILSTLLLALPCTGKAQSLREAADLADISIGAAVNVQYLSETSYAETLGREFNMLEPEDAMKWEALRPDEKTFAFGDSDRIVQFALTHRMKVRGHTLLWGAHNPDWLVNGNYSSKQLSDLLHDHISRVVEHFRGQVFAWDVVNEAFEEHGKLRSSLWFDKPGIAAGPRTEYIAQAFRWAHDADPKALLFYNDAEAEQINAKSDAIYAMVKEFRERNIPIDGVGLQMHFFELNPDFSSITANIARFTNLGIKIHITELDVALPVNELGNASPVDLRRQAEIYREITRICLQNPRCSAIQTWGFTDKYSWLGWATHKTKGEGLLFDRTYHPKPAYGAVQQELICARRTTH